MPAQVDQYFGHSCQQLLKYTIYQFHKKCYIVQSLPTNIKIS